MLNFSMKNAVLLGVGLLASCTRLDSSAPTEFVGALNSEMTLPQVQDLYIDLLVPPNQPSEYDLQQALPDGRVVVVATVVRDSRARVFPVNDLDEILESCSDGAICMPLTFFEDLESSDLFAPGDLLMGRFYIENDLGGIHRFVDLIFSSRDQRLLGIVSFSDSGNALLPDQF